jgi:flagellar protein FlbD
MTPAGTVANGVGHMIVLTRLNGPSFALNPDLIERVEANPDTVVVLIGGASYPIAESVDELLARVRNYRGQVIASAHAAEFQYSEFPTPELAQSDQLLPELPPAALPPIAHRRLRIMPQPESDS